MHQPTRPHVPGGSSPVPPPSERTRLRRKPQRASYALADVHAILDAALICHVGFLRDGAPSVIPSVFVRIDDALFLHGSTANRALRVVAAGEPVCIEVTQLDALVLARSAFHQSLNYRSVVVYGRGEPVTDAAKRLAALRATVEHVCPGRWADVRPPDREELLRTFVVRVPLGEHSAKIRSGDPADDEPDYALDVWAGLLPLALTPAPPRDDARLRPGIAAPEYVRGWLPPGRRPRHGQ